MTRTAEGRWFIGTCVAVAGLIIGTALFVSCGQAARPTMRPGEDTVVSAVRRIRFAEDRVTCYISIASGDISCLRDTP